jgi:ribulose-phosphate 3-epimerase
MGRSIKLSASLICADLLNLQRDLSILEKGGFHYIHFDMMDGHFVPRIGLGASFLRQITGGQSLPVEVHLMVADPVRYIAEIAEAGATMISFHYETGTDIYRTVSCIKDCGMKAGIALRPFTPLCHIEPLLDYLDMVLLMAYSPGTTGQSSAQNFGTRVGALHELLQQRGREQVDIAVDGGVSEEVIPKFAKQGANFFVFGTSGLFMPDRDLEQQVGTIQRIVRGL